FFSLISPLAIWCYFQEHYHKKNIGRLVVALNVLGLIVALSRAPMMGFFMGLVIIYYGWSQNKAAIMSIVLLVATVVLMMAVPKFIEYASVTRATAATEDQRNVAYRKEMWEAYTEVVLERPYLGWGRFSVPAVKGMKSIDSEYLGVALASGLPALGFYLVFLFGMLFRLMRFAGRAAHDDPWGRLAWCLIAGWVSAIFSLATVYSGAQTVQYLYMLGAVGQVLILTPQLQRSFFGTKALSPELADHQFHFIRVI
ncbi:MAG: O-antigen ligase family protein, partial [Deltaproteobacteria bacterium]|nr:O-antigen ligase family protein [Deltaproteobacteria bacterium]